MGQLLSFIQSKSMVASFDKSLDAALSRTQKALEAGRTISEFVIEIDAAMQRGPQILRELQQTHAALKDVRGPKARKLGITRLDKLELQDDLRRIRASCDVWRRMRPILEKIENPELRPLYAPLTAIEKAKNRPIDRLVHALDHAINPAPQDPESKSRGHYWDIRLPISKFQEHLNAVSRLLIAAKVPRPWRFLDVGCGGGVKVLAALSYVDEAVGLEFDPGYVAAATQLAAHWPDRMSIQQGDALAFDDYGGFDVIYAYQPIANDTLLQQLELRISTEASGGTFVVLPYQSILIRAEEMGLTRIVGSIFMAGAKALDVDDLVEKGERIGPDCPLSATALPERLKQWAGLIEGCRMHGYDALITMQQPV